MPPKEVFGEPDAEAVTCDVADRVITNNKSIHDEEDPGIDSLFLCSLPGLRSIILLCILIFDSFYRNVPGLIAHRQPQQKSNSNVAKGLQFHSSLVQVVTPLVSVGLRIEWDL